jgi:hypothetical protein
MIIPKYWAEARLQHRERHRQVTVRRFGWSDQSAEAAQAHADARVREALQRVLAGEELPRRERRVAYNGAEGVPIREEIVRREGDSVVSRNGYGALCLNTPDVLFADIDFDRSASARGLLIAGLVLMAGMSLVPKYMFDRGLLTALAIGLGAALLLAQPLAGLVLRLRLALAGGVEAMARKRVRAFIAQRPQWRLRVYRTPAGLRLLALHRRFDPREPEVAEAFKALGVDPAYARMCHRQNCFRARLTPKPWRLGLPRLRAPCAAAWRLEHAELPERRAWISAYERASAGHAACRYLETLGQGPLDAGAEQIRQVHDQACRAEQELPLA